MKTFKRVYFLIMAVIALFVITFSLISPNIISYKKECDDAFYNNVEKHLNYLAKGQRNEFNVSQLNASRDYIRNELASVATVVDTREDTSDDKLLATVATLAGKPSSSMTIQTMQVWDSTQKLIKRENVAYSVVAKTVSNVIVYVPGLDTKNGSTADAVLFTAHYDSVSTGAIDNASAVSAMIESIRYILENDTQYKNDLVFVFTDGEEQGALGAFTFMHQFKGFSNVPARVKLGINFDSLGADGSLMLYETSENNKNLISTYAKLNGSNPLSSVLTYQAKGNTEISDFDAFGSIPALSFANVGGADRAKSTSDSVNDTALKLSYQQSDLMVKLMNFYGEYELDDLTSQTDATFFSYLNLFSFRYSNIVSYILTAILVLMLVGAVYLNAKKNSFSWLRAVIGMFVQLLAISATIAVLYVCYFVVTLILSGFGVIPISIIATLRYTNFAILMLMFVLSCVISTGFYAVLKKAFNIKGGDVVRGNVLIGFIVALILGFALPSVGYMFIFASILQLAVMIASSLLRDVYNKKALEAVEKGYKGNPNLQGIGGLFLYVWATILSIPIIIPVIVIISQTSLALMLPLLSAMFLLLAGSILPYADYLKALGEKLFEKLPARKVTRKVKCIEKVEDRAKKGKFTEQEVIKKEVIEIKRVYTHIFSITILSIICVISLIFASAFGAKFNRNLTAWKTYDNSIYDSSIVYEWEQVDGSTVTNLIIKDPMVYKYSLSCLVDYKWDGDRGAYVKEYNNPVLQTATPDVTKSGETYSFSVYDQTRGRVILNLSDVGSVTKFTFDNGTETFEFENTSALSQIEFCLPYGFGSFTMTTEGGSSITIAYEESVIGNRKIEEIIDVVTLREKYSNNEDVSPFIDSGMVLRYTKSI